MAVIEISEVINVATIPAFQPDVSTLKMTARIKMSEYDLSPVGPNSSIVNSDAVTI